MSATVPQWGQIILPARYDVEGIPERYRNCPFVLKCTECSLPGKPSLLTSLDSSNLRKHRRVYRSSDRTIATVDEHEGDDEETVPIISARSLAEACVTAGLNFAQAENVAHVHNLSIDRREIQLEADQMIRHFDEWLSAYVGLQHFFPVSIDGGTSKGMCNHVLIITIHSEQRSYVLRPWWAEEGSAFNGASVVKAVIRTLSTAGVMLHKVKHWMVDGARYNTVAIEALGHAQRISSVAVAVSKSFPDPDDDPTADREYVRETHWIGAVQTALESMELRTASELLCRGHVTMLRINRALTCEFWKNCFAAEVVKLTYQMLFSGENAATRKGRLLRHLEKVDNARKAAVLGVGSIQQFVSIACSQTTFTLGTIERFKRLAVSTPVSVIAASLSHTATDGQVREAFDECASILKKLDDKHLAPFALGNATRWHSSVFKSHEFLAANLMSVADWAASEGAPNPSMQRFLLLRDVHSIARTQLHIYVECFKELAEFLEWLSDGSRTVPLALFLASKTSALLADYQRKAATEEGLKAELYKSIVKGLEWSPDRGMCESMWTAISYLHPKQMALSDIPMTAREFSVATNVEVDQVEWDSYRCDETRISLVDENPVAYWETKRHQWPALYLAVKYLIWLPVTVTSCDGVLSVEGTVVTSRRGRLDPERAGAIIQWKCNGNPLEKRPHMRQSWGAPKN